MSRASTNLVTCERNSFCDTEIPALTLFVLFGDGSVHRHGAQSEAVSARARQDTGQPDVWHL